MQQIAAGSRPSGAGGAPLCGASWGRWTRPPGHRGGQGTPSCASPAGLSSGFGSPPLVRSSPCTRLRLGRCCRTVLVAGFVCNVHMPLLQQSQLRGSLYTGGQGFTALSSVRTDARWLHADIADSIGTGTQLPQRRQPTCPGAALQAWGGAAPLAAQSCTPQAATP